MSDQPTLYVQQTIEGVPSFLPVELDYEAASNLLMMIVNSGVDLSAETLRLFARDVVKAALREATDD